MNAGRHREPPATVAEVVSAQASASTRLAAIGVLGSATALAAPGMASAATVGGPGPGAAAAGSVSAPAGLVTAPAGAVAPPAGFVSSVPFQTSARPTIHVVVIGDSFTSGEGANSSTYTTTPMQISPLTGDVFPPLVYPQHQSTNSAVMQAINALQAANPNVDIQVTNVSVSGATRVSAASPSYPGTFFEQPAQLDAVKNADIIFNGFAGGNDNHFADWAQNSLVAPDDFMTNVWNSIYAPNFTNGTNLAAQTAFLNNLAQQSPGATIITPSYPEAFQGVTAPSWSVTSPWMSSLGPNAAKLSDGFSQWLSADSQAATGAANIANAATGTTFLDVNMLNAMSGHTLNSAEPGMNGIVLLSPGQAAIGQSSLHPNPLGQSLEASAIYPVLAAALNHVGGQQGFPVNTDPPSSIQITPSYQQNADGVQTQMSLLTQIQQAGDMAKLATQAQNGELTNPDGSLTAFGQLMSGLGQQGSAPAWPAPPTAPATPGDAAPAAPAQPAQDITDPGVQWLDFGGPPSMPAPSTWSGPPQGGAPAGAPASGAPQSGAPGSAAPQDGAPQGQPAGTGSTAPAGGTDAAPPAPAGGAAASGAAAAPATGTPAAPSGDTSTAPAAPADPAAAPAAPADPAAAPAPPPAAPASPTSFTSTPDPTAASPGAAPTPIPPATSAPAPVTPAVSTPANPAPVIPAVSTPANPAPVIPAVSTPAIPTPVIPAISTPTMGIPAPLPITPTPMVTAPGPISTPGLTTSAPASAPMITDPGPAVFASASGGGVGSG